MHKLRPTHAQDGHAVSSHERARKAMASGWAAKEIVPVHVSRPGGGSGGDRPVVVDQDEGPSKFNADKLRSLRPAFKASDWVV
jgi:acetyl-CoA acetyltransferase